MHNQEIRNQEVLDILYESGISWSIDVDVVKEAESLSKKIEQAGQADANILIASIKSTADWSGNDYSGIINILQVFYNAISLHKKIEERETQEKIQTTNNL